MKTIPMPKSREERIDVIERYFYGSFPHFQEWDRDSKQYPAFHVLDGFTREQEPEPRIVIAEHVDGTRTWASRAVSPEGAHFAALDVDITDAAALANLRECLDAVYGEGSYNWEQRKGTGVHVWFLWDGVVTLNCGKALIELLLERTIGCEIDRKYPIERVPLRLPFPGEYDPMPTFQDDELHILECDDFTRLSIDKELLGMCGPECECESAVSLSCEGMASNTLGSTPDTNVPDTTREEDKPYCQGHRGTPLEACPGIHDHHTILTDRNLRPIQQVKLSLAIPPQDGATYDTLITHCLLTKTLGVFGSEQGLRKLRDWIRSGRREKIAERLIELEKYDACSRSKGFRPAIAGPLCRPPDLRLFQNGMFEDQLSFIDKRPVRANVELCLFIMLVCEERARLHAVNPWWISTRQLAELMGREPESGRKTSGRDLSWIVEGLGANDYPVFRVVQDHTRYKARRFAMNPQYEFLLDRLPDLPDLPPLITGSH